MTMRTIRSLAVCALLAGQGACAAEAPVVGRPATEAEKDAMPGFLITLDRQEITVLTPLEPPLPGCEIELDQRWRATIRSEERGVGARVPLADFRDDAGAPPRGLPTRVEVTCAGASGPLRYTGRRSGSGGGVVTAWIFPDA